jgi:hypothetical protein
MMTFNGSTIPEQSLKMQLVPAVIILRLANGPGKAATKRLQQVIFYKGGLADGEAVRPEGQKEVLYAVFYELFIFGEAAAIIKEVLVVGPHKPVEGIGIAVAELIPKKEIFVQKVDRTHSSR